MWREPKPSRTFTSSGKRASSRHVRREPAARARDAAPLEEEVRVVLVADRPADLRLGHEHERGRERVALRGEQDLVEVGQRHDQAHVVLGDQRGERRDVAGTVDASDERVMVGVVERRRERVEVGRDGRRAGPAER